MGRNGKRCQFMRSLKKLKWIHLEKSKWLELIKEFANSPDDVVTMILCAIKADNKFYDNADMMVQNIKDLIQKKFDWEVDVSLVGCTSNRLALKCSDVNIFINFDKDDSLLGQRGKMFVEALKCLEGLINFEIVKKDDSLIQNAQFEAFGLKFSLIYLPKIELFHTDLIANFISLDEKIKDMIIFIRFYMQKSVEITCNTTRLQSSTVSFLVLFYFQRTYHLDPICNYMNYEGEMESGWWVEVHDYLKNFDKSFLKDISIIQLLEGFFKFYSDFNFARDVVCPYIGRALTKHDLSDPFSVPKQYFDLIEDLKLDREKVLFEFNNELCVQDPFFHRRNLTKDLDANVLNNIIEAFKNASSVFAEKDKNVLCNLFSKFGEEINCNNGLIHVV